MRSFDGTPIVATFMPAEGLAEGGRAPTVLIGHGFGQSRETSRGAGTDASIAGAVGPATLLEAGYNVLTWDARGFGGSGGRVHIDSRDWEGRDVQALFDHVASQPEAQLDAPGDPRVGMAGPSYGGAIQLLTAAIDDRVDAIVPSIAWHSLLTALYQDRAVKAGWGAALFGLGVATAGPQGLPSPAGPQLGSLDEHITSAFVQGASTGTFSPEDEHFLATRGATGLFHRIQAPTLLIQGTVDTLFPLDEATRTFQILQGNGVPVKMLWFCGGHGACLTEPGEPPIAERTLAWFDHYLKGRDADTGPTFAWIADDGERRSAANFPLARKRGVELGGAAAGTLALQPVTAAGNPIAASAGLPNLTVPVDEPERPVDVVGAPTLELTYRGTSVMGRSHVYAILVDTRSGRAYGNQATPIPIVLDGEEHTVTRDLEMVAAVIGPQSDVELQLVPATTLYFDAQRDLGALEVRSAEVELPVTDPAATPPPGAGASGDAAEAVRLSLPDGLRTGARRVRVRVRTSGEDRRLRVSLTRRGRTILRSGFFTATGNRVVTLRPLRGRRVRAGAHTLRASTPAGRQVERRRVRAR